jgi:hypothetical protein
VKVSIPDQNQLHISQNNFSYMKPTPHSFIHYFPVLANRIVSQFHQQLQSLHHGRTPELCKSLLVANVWEFDGQT